MPNDANIAPDVRDKISKRLGKWRNELLDLTRNNRLVYYKPSAKALRLDVPDVYAIADRLDADGKGWLFYEPPEPESDESEVDEAAAPAEPDSVSPAPEPEDGVLYTHEQNRTKLRSALKAVKQRAHEALEERGVHVLYLAAGALYWTEGDSPELSRSPLILFPVTIRQESRTQPYELVPSLDEEIIGNAGLLEKLRRDLDIELPDLPSPDQIDRSDGDDLCRTYFEAIDQLITPEQRRLGWKVTPEAWLDVFTFHKLVMYVDLEKNRERIAGHPAISAMVGGRPGPDAFGPPLPEDDCLDERTLIRDACHVMDADSSQLAVLEAVRRGTSLVLVGPPGTGKSQTIANVISQSVAEGKTVLFVSEKMEALDVVYRRLRDAGIEDLCLQLHSHKANKKSVIAELARRMSERLEANLAIDDAALIKLDARRESLNEYARELHAIRQPFGKSIRHALSEVVDASSTHLPAVPQAERAAVERMTAGAWSQIEDCAVMMASVWHVIEAPERLAWLGAHPRMLDRQTSAEIESELNALGRTLDVLRARGAALAAGLGAKEPHSPIAALDQVELAQELCKSPGVPGSYFLQPFDLLQTRMQATRAQIAEIARLRGQVGSLVPEQPRFVAEELTTLAQRVQAALKGWLSGAISVRAAQALGGLLHEMAEAAGGYQTAAASVAASLSLTDRFTPGSLERLRRVAAQCLDSAALPAALLAPALLTEARSVLPKRKPLWAAANAATTALAEVADESILGLDLDAQLASYRTSYDNFLRVFKPSYWRAEREIKQHLKPSGAALPRADVLERARTARESRQAVQALESQDAQLFGSLAQCSHTDVAALDAAVVRAIEILALVDARPLPPQLIEALTCGGLVPSTFRTAVAALAQAHGRFAAVIERLAALGGSGTASPEALQDIPVTEIATWARNTAALLTSSTADIAAIPAQAAACSLTEYALLVGVDATRRELVATLDRAAPDLTALFGDVYRGETTDFAALEQKLRFAEHLRAQFAPLLVPSVLALAAQVRPSIAQLAEAAVAGTSYRTAEATLAQRFVQGTVTTYGRALSSRSYVDALAGLDHLRRASHEIADIARVGSVKARFREHGLANTLETLLAERGAVDQFKRRLRGSLYQCWLDHQIAHVAILRDFNGLEHQQRVKEFRELDRRMWEHGAHRVIAGFNARRPEHRIRTQEHAVLQREAIKSRRIMPLRRLFSEIPTLIPQLKPCLMMSPISIAQYLADSDATFDLVVFDEASQIAPEDAIGALVRGRQVVMCGDPKQLPPTAFFERSFLDGGDKYDEDDDVLAVDSILEELQGAGLQQKSLTWHYRSQHPDLIEFSNQKFYESSLVTFPNRIDSSHDLGVKFVHVDDGLYDRGKSRTNRIEAERVADLVIDHWKRWGKQQTLAVVTLSSAQQEAVRVAIEEKLGRHREFEGYYRDEARDGFRVKNLENVQGDERDVIIVSIGYGPDVLKGKPSKHFGPINQQGGARRLNVLVTRAKRKLILVASFRGQDLPIEEKSNDGVRLLLKYMDFAERGMSALQAEVEGGGDFESPLEASVAHAVRGFGYDVVPQVGCGRYRIDLGVRRLDQPGAFLLGIECDGARYHGSATARDRDRLRQQVLERFFGWTIHRIWGPDWLRARPREEQRLRDALDRASTREVGTPAAAVQAVERTPIAKTVVAPPVDLKTAEARPAWSQPFVAASADRLGLGSDRPVTQETARTLAQQIARIAQAENGVHFDRAIYVILEARGVKRLGSAIRDHFKKAKSALPQGFEFEAGFVYPPEYAPRVLVWDGTGERRELEAVPRREVELAARKILEGAGALPWDELIEQLARLYGVQRVTQQSRAALEPALEAARKAGRLVRDGVRVTNA